MSFRGLLKHQKPQIDFCFNNQFFLCFLVCSQELNFCNYKYWKKCYDTSRKIYCILMAELKGCICYTTEMSRCKGWLVRKNLFYKKETHLYVHHLIGSRNSSAQMFILTKMVWYRPSQDNVWVCIGNTYSICDEATAVHRYLSQWTVTAVQLLNYSSWLLRSSKWFSWLSIHMFTPKMKFQTGNSFKGKRAIVSGCNLLPAFRLTSNFCIWMLSS